MRFSTSAFIAALPALAAAQEDPFQQYKAQFQNVLDKFGSYIPKPSVHDPVAAAEAKIGEKKLSILTIDNWKDTLYEPVSADATTPVEWWVLISGRNKTCYGRCGRVEAAFNETAAKFAVLPGSPYMGYVNCDDQPILCNSWSATPTNMWAFEMLPAPAPINIYKKRLNATTVTSEDIVALRNADRETSFKPVDGVFHPFNGKIAELGLSTVVGYIFWGFGVVPSWLTMLIISMVSRSMMSSRMQQMANPPARQGRQ
ncbi:peptidyl-tRNA hydrolase [Paramyrothecium foliicola]|nr:peptidyl-tRNA hydrolase [Paramyrothecium foliicola]